MPSNPRWARRPEGSTWGDFGPDDELGRLNLITPDKVRSAVAEVKRAAPSASACPSTGPAATC